VEKCASENYTEEKIGGKAVAGRTEGGRHQVDQGEKGNSLVGVEEWPEKVWGTAGLPFQTKVGERGLEVNHSRRDTKRDTREKNGIRRHWNQVGGEKDCVVTEKKKVGRAQRTSPRSGRSSQRERRRPQGGKVGSHPNKMAIEGPRKEENKGGRKPDVRKVQEGTSKPAGVQRRGGWIKPSFIGMGKIKEGGKGSVILSGAKPRGKKCNCQVAKAESTKPGGEAILGKRCVRTKIDPSAKAGGRH